MAKKKKASMPIASDNTDASSDANDTQSSEPTLTDNTVIDEPEKDTAPSNAPAESTEESPPGEEPESEPADSEPAAEEATEDKPPDEPPDLDTEEPPIIPAASFEETVEELSVDDIQSSFNGKKQRILNTMFLTRLLALIICTSLFIYCIYSISTRIADDINNREILDELVHNAEQQSILSRVQGTKLSPSSLSLYDALGVTEYTTEWKEIDYTGKYDTIRYTLEELKKSNSDVYGWIRCKDGMTSINNPIVKTTDNDYYLNHNILHENSASGTIFADYRNSYKHSDNLNTIFYGHNMTNGMMFRAVKDWFDSATRNTTASQITIELITLDAVYVYEIFAAYRSEGADFITVSFANEGAYVKFLQSLLNKSVLKRKIAYDANSRIITLSTCTNVVSRPDERYVVHGILKKIINYS